MKNLILIFSLLLATSCASFQQEDRLPEGVECLSLSGAELRAPELSDERRAELDGNLEQARAHYAANPQDEMAAIWVGRRLGYLGRYNEAIGVYTEAIAKHPNSFRLLRHRGHRHLSLRRFPEAIADLREAARLAEGIPDEYEQDGAPNPFGIPRSTTHSNIFYHLGLVLFLEAEYDEALVAWQRCLYFSRVNDDMEVAATYWTVLTLWRLGRDKVAQGHLETIDAKMDILENHDYHKLLLLFQGTIDEPQFIAQLDGDELTSATAGFGLGAWHMHEGREERAMEIFKGIVDATYWPAFGHIAAEVELARR